MNFTSNILLNSYFKMYLSVRFYSSGYNHPKIFLPAPNFGASFESFSWWMHTLGFTPWARMSLCINLPCAFHQVLHVDVKFMLATMFWLCSKSVASFALVMFAMKSSVTLTHRVTFTVGKASSWPTNDQSKFSHLSCTLWITHLVHMCLDGLSHPIIESCKCVL